MGGLAESLVNFRGPLLREMVSAGHEVYACAPEASPEVEASLADMGVTYRSVPLDRTGINPVRDLFSIMKLVSIFRTIRPEVFLGYTIKPVIYGSIAAQIAGVPATYTMITGLGYSFSGAGFRSRVVGMIAGFLYGVALGFNKNVFFQNPDDMALFGDKGILREEGKAVLINGSGVDVDEFEPADFPPEISFLLIARLIRDKGIYEYVEAARMIREKYPQVTFRLAGWLDGNPHAIAENDLRTWIEAGDVDYLGRLSDVRPALADCSVYILPSYREGIPRTVLEAMAMGRPVITTDAPGCRETVSNGRNGILVRVRDVMDLAEAMESFIGNPDLIEKMGIASREIAEEKYDVRKVNSCILQTMRLV